MYSLIGKWTILPGCEQEAHKALIEMANDVNQNEPDTLIYQVYIPDFNEVNLPTPPSGQIIFYEVYKNKDASVAHIQGPIFQNFIKTYGKLFLNDFSEPSQIYMSLEILTQVGGFVRSTAVE